MQLPGRLKEKLLAHARLGMATQACAEEFSAWLSSSSMPLFPEYTEHGLGHVESVLMSASALVSDEAWEVLTPTDAGVFVFATLFHDSAMHLTEAGFLDLVSEPRSSLKVAGYPGDADWSVLWDQFMAEAKRFSGRKLMNLFGHTEPVRTPPLNVQEMRREDRLLIGEFVRRHHARLAHEIAIYGVPGPQEQKLQPQIPRDLNHFLDLAGLVARSHGMPLRTALIDLQQRYDLREFQGVHAVYLMCLLRIADYIQVQAERAPRQRLLVEQIRSPLSRREWDTHHAIRNIRSDEDPAAIYVDALPANVQIYQRLRELLSDIQVELDASWAVLGEVYGRYANEGWDRFGLTLRRIRSNVFDQASLRTLVDYIPRLAAFEAVDPDLMKLLVHPLYGDRPEIGIRELMQNAIDAVRERQELVRKNPELAAAPDGRARADVVVELDTKSDEPTLTIHDSGIGMTEDVLCDYFLKAGASFRQSDYWRAHFETDEGRSTVLRSGRFGIGALAAFLLGDEMFVSTRHITRLQHEGVQFSATLDTEAIEMRPMARAAGTTIRVKLSRATADELTRVPTSWDWYCGRDPSVRRTLNGAELPQKHVLPEAAATPLPRAWYRLEHGDYADVQWTYHRAPALACNGIVVSLEPVSWGNSGHVPFAMPHVSVFDPNGKLPLKLQRERLRTATYPFTDELLRSVTSDVVAFALARAASAPMSNAAAYPWYFRPAAKLGLNDGWRISEWSEFLSTPDGVVLTHPALLRLLEPTRILVLPSAEEHHIDELRGKIRAPAIGARLGSRGRTADWLKGLLRLLSHPRVLSNNPFADLDLTGIRVFTNTATPLSLDDARIVGRVELLEGSWTVVAYGRCGEPIVDYGGMLDVQRRAEGDPLLSNRAPRLIAEVHVSPSARLSANIVSDTWLELLGRPYVSFDATRRHEQLLRVRERIEPYLQAQESVRGAGRKANAPGAPI